MSLELTSDTDLGLVQDLLNERANEIQRLQTELGNKQELVQAITARLEETVEQLDRLQRQGNNRPGQPGGAGSVKDVLESQNALADRVDQSLACWESTASYFEQILQRLDELQSLPAGSGPAREAPAASSSVYERMKANLMAQAPPLLSAAPSAPNASNNSSAADASGAALQDVSAPPPVPVDIEQASREELMEAVTARDQYITFLIQSFRTRDDAILLKVDWNKLQSAPEDLRPQLLALGQRLKEKIQREELDHSMERARLAREQARIDLVKQQLEAQIRRLSSPAPSTAPAAEEKKSKDSWLNRLKK